MQISKYKPLLSITTWLLCAGCTSLPSGHLIRQQSALLTEGPEIRRSSEILSYSVGSQLLHQAIPDYAERNLLRRHFYYEAALSRWPIVAANRAELLIDGPETYQAMFDSMRAAENHVHLETFILADDSVGQELKNILMELLDKGVEIRIIYDAFGSFNTADAFFDDLRENGALVHKFNPLNPLQNLRIWKINHRDHRKIIIVDGQTAFIGGINISDVYSKSSFTRPLKKQNMENRWRDTHLQLYGPAVADIQELFLENWIWANGKEMSQFETAPYFPVLPAAGEHAVRIISSRGGDGEHRIYKILLSAVTHAEERVWITQGYFAPNRHFINELVKAAERGVDVRLLLPAFTDSWITLNATRAHYTELLKAGVKLFVRTDALLHAKTAVVDGVWSTVGSANLDYRSFIHSDEANAVVYGREFGNKMEELFLFDQAHTQSVSLEYWQKRSFRLKLMERLAALFKYWL